MSLCRWYAQRVVCSHASNGIWRVVSTNMMPGSQTTLKYSVLRRRNLDPLKLQDSISVHNVKRCATRRYISPERERIDKPASRCINKSMTDLLRTVQILGPEHVLLLTGHYTRHSKNNHRLSGLLHVRACFTVSTQSLCQFVLPDVYFNCDSAMVLSARSC